MQFFELEHRGILLNGGLQDKKIYLRSNTELEVADDGERIPTISLEVVLLTDEEMERDYEIDPTFRNREFSDGRSAIQTIRKKHNNAISTNTGQPQPAQVIQGHSHRIPAGERVA